MPYKNPLHQIDARQTLPVGARHLGRLGPFYNGITVMSVVVRTHGGLGNQIFQLLYARLFAARSGVALLEAHDVRYPHAFGRTEELSRHPAPQGIAKVLSELRLPKVATKLKIRRDSAKIFGDVYLDGYFQRVADYAPFADEQIRDELLRLRSELDIPRTATRDHGVHLRLGDFFTTEAAVAEHLAMRLTRVRRGADIVTNEEARLATPAVRTALYGADARILPTGQMSAEDVLRTLASFREVDGNDSTLLFWASVLSGMTCDFENPELRALRARFLEILR